MGKSWKKLEKVGAKLGKVGKGGEKCGSGEMTKV